MSTRRRRYTQCKYDFFPHTLHLCLTRREWREIFHLFLMEQSSNTNVEQTGLDKKRVLRALHKKKRMVLAKDIPDIFSSTVEVDETYVGGQWKNYRKIIRDAGTKRGRGTKKQPIFGIIRRNGIVWAEVVNDVEARILQPLITRQTAPGSVVNSDT